MSDLEHSDNENISDTEISIEYDNSQLKPTFSRKNIQSSDIIQGSVLDKNVITAEDNENNLEDDENNLEDDENNLDDDDDIDDIDDIDDVNSEDGNNITNEKNQKVSNILSSNQTPAFNILNTSTNISPNVFEKNDSDYDSDDDEDDDDEYLQKFD